VLPTDLRPIPASVWLGRPFMQRFQAKGDNYPVLRSVRKQHKLRFSVAHKSNPTRKLPDLFLSPAWQPRLMGVFPGRSLNLPFGHTWNLAGFKAPTTKQPAGTVPCNNRSASGLPEINFHYFQEGNDASCGMISKPLCAPFLNSLRSYVR